MELDHGVPGTTNPTITNIGIKVERHISYFGHADSVIISGLPASRDGVSKVTLKGGNSTEIKVNLVKGDEIKICNAAQPGIDTEWAINWCYCIWYSCCRKLCNCYVIKQVQIKEHQHSLLK